MAKPLTRIQRFTKFVPKPGMQGSVAGRLARSGKGYLPNPLVFGLVAAVIIGVISTSMTTWFQSHQAPAPCDYQSWVGKPFNKQAIREQARPYRFISAGGKIAPSGEPQMINIELQGIKVVNVWCG